MKASEAARLRRKWRRWIGAIGNLVALAGMDDYIFVTSMNIAARAGAILPNNEVYRWAMRVYGTHLAVGLRRLVDTDDKTYSLMHLVRAIYKNPQVITRRSFVQRYPKRMRHIAQADFDSIAGGHVDCLPRSVVEADLHSLEAVASRIRPVVDKVVVHRERKPRGRKRITWREQHDAIAEIDRICVRYTSILNQVGMWTVLPVNMEDCDRDIEAVWGKKSK